MSEEKTFGQIAYEATESWISWDDRHTHKELWEVTAKAVIEEYLRRNGEPVGYFQLNQYGPDPTHEQVDAEYKKDDGVFPLFAAPQPLPTSEPPIHEVELDTLYRLLNGCGTDGDQMVAAVALDKFNPIDSEISIDVSTGEHDAYDRIFAKIIGWQEHNGKGIYLAVEESRNFKSETQPLPTVEEIADVIYGAIPEHDEFDEEDDFRTNIDGWSVEVANAVLDLLKGKK